MTKKSIQDQNVTNIRNVQSINGVDTDSGEILEGVYLWVPGAKKNAFKEWIAMSQNGFEVMRDLKKNKELSLNDCIVFDHLMTILDFDNYILTSNKEIAEGCGIGKNNIKRHIDKLIKLEIISEGPKKGRSKGYKLNPLVAWKGTGSKHRQQVKKIEQDKVVSINKKLKSRKD